MMLSSVKKIIPRSVLLVLLPFYHFAVALLSAVLYRFPSRSLNVVVVTGTKGKTTTTELINAILEEAGHTTALANTLRFKIGHESQRNMLKMTTPGRFFLQHFLKKAVRSECAYAVIEMSSEGAKQFRHRFIDLDALVVTNVSPEHIESHGSYEKYKEAKLSIARKLERSPKKRAILVVNKDDKESAMFLSVLASETYAYSLDDVTSHSSVKDGMTITIDGKRIHSHLPGTFNIYNILAAIMYARTQDISLEVIASALEGFRGIRGRMERVYPLSPSLRAQQHFEVIVDYAHTADSLEKAYKVFDDKKKICILGGTGGGRDKWKRVKMGEIASTYCSEIILTNEDPYDEDPQAILLDIGKGIKNKHVYTVLNRREAIRKGIEDAKKDYVVFITGKGTDPYIMEKDGAKVPWDDATVAREELEKVLTTR